MMRYPRTGHPRIRQRGIQEEEEKEGRGGEPPTSAHSTPLRTAWPLSGRDIIVLAASHLAGVRGMVDKRPWLVIGVYPLGKVGPDSKGRWRL